MILPPHAPCGYTNVLTIPTYAPEKFVDSLIRRLGARNDAGLSRILSFHPAVICKIRKRRVGVSADVLLRIFDVTDIPINELRAMMGVPVPDLKKAVDINQLGDR